jgi:hypothetical protein
MWNNRLMVRLLFPLLLLVAGALVVALVRDRRERDVLLLAELRDSFLHGAPLGGFASTGGLTELQAPGGLLRFRLPAAWTGGFHEPKTASFDCGSGRRLHVDLRTVERRGGQALLESLAATRPEPERSLETLARGHLLLKYLEARGQNPNPRVAFCWQLARPLSSEQARVAILSFVVPREQAGEVFVRADLGLLDREVRNATLCDQISPLSARSPAPCGPS